MSQTPTFDLVVIGGEPAGVTAVLAAFAITARDETDLDALTAELVRVVQETMQPERVNVWLKEIPRQ